jgi:mono/diheme cytochrome c family protein
LRRRESNLVCEQERQSRAPCIAVLICLTASAGCEQKMAAQPSYRPLVRSRFFADGRASRPLVAGTISRSASELDASLISGRKSTTAPAPAPSGANTSTMLTQPPAGIRPDEFVTEFPFQITHDVLARGQERYAVYCAMCHDPVGTGNGQIIRRGFTKPPSYLADNSRQLARSGFQVPLREVPVGYLFDVATNGYGAMADYAEQVPPRDRWAIAAYIRTLQLSQNIRLDDLPPNIRNEAAKVLEATP